MDIGFIGPGKVGSNMALNVHEQGWPIIGLDVIKEARAAARRQELPVVDSLSGLLKAFNRRKVIFLSTPAGRIVNQLVVELVEQLAPENVTVDNGSSNFHDSVANAQLAKEEGVYFVDCSTLGGTKGAREGACSVVGGAPEAVKMLTSFFENLACEQGYLYAGKSGAGHYLKTTHNGVEYVVMQTMGEGFDSLETAEHGFALEKIADVWNHDSIIEVRLMGLAKEVFTENPTLANLEGKAAVNGEAKWMIEGALHLEMSVPTTMLSLFIRNKSILANHFPNKVVASLRQGLGGHEVIKGQ